MAKLTETENKPSKSVSIIFLCPLTLKVKPSIQTNHRQATFDLSSTHLILKGILWLSQKNLDNVR